MSSSDHLQAILAANPAREEGSSLPATAGGDRLVITDPDTPADPLSDLAVATFAAAQLAAEDAAAHHDAPTHTGPIRVNRAGAAAWFAGSLRPLGWNPGNPWNPLSVTAQTADGWIRTHANAPAHHAALLDALGLAADTGRDRLITRLSQLTAAEAEDRIVGFGGAAARLHTAQEWEHSLPGQAVASEPLIAWEPTGFPVHRDLDTVSAQPLLGVRVLDLTRVIAGPVATRALALLGADVVRIDPPDWSEPALEAEMLLGKRTARLDLHHRIDRERFLNLLAEADVLVHGYRADALEKLGFGDRERARIRPGLTEVALNAYGWSGPWRNRRGFDSLVQFSTGLAAVTAPGGSPVSLPVQALDHATGMIAATAALRAWTHSRTHGEGLRARVSLARTAELIRGVNPETPLAGGVSAGAPDPRIEHTSWGLAQRLPWPAASGRVRPHTDHPARALGADAPRWAV
ncbi:acyl-CoA transferase [Mycetocola tolaasinivorans]|uniref:Acyl-CoA transferase n=1 Tax=Mycetocola tolaasinivorans TaxID=76635 RepID=A0A3L7A2S8_9MICO|nr:CoA transferase [Mycetocola tolaasinivorans]RLP74305.1 acyl-CoA transferase [Mycetocola tolaasinivorans]